MKTDQAKADQTKKPNGRTGRMLKTAGLVLLSAVLVLYVLLPIGMGVFASTRGLVAQEPPPEGFTTVELTAEDGTQLESWYGAGENGDCVILVHGAKNNLSSLMEHAAFLREAGYGVLALALRGHAGSGGRGNAFGWQCGQDVAAAVDYLRAQGVAHIGALGLSLGAEVLLGSAADEPAIAAIIADGASQRSLADYQVLENNRTIWRSWSTRVMYASVRLFSGQTPPERTLLSSVTDAKNTRFLFIAAGSVEKESTFGGLFAAAAADRAELWVVPGAGHTQGLFAAPKEYTARVIEFLDESL